PGTFPKAGGLPPVGARPPLQPSGHGLPGHAEGSHPGKPFRHGFRPGVGDLPPPQGPLEGGGIA
ncbi:hypothetical protein ABTO41_19260, partial [Acinetobacter baumannii]